MSKKIKILFVMDSYDSVYGGGTEGQLYNLIKILNKDKFEPELCLYRYVNDFFDKNLFPCKVFCLGIKSFYSISSYIKLFKLRRYVKRNGIDIVQTIFNDTALSIPLTIIGLSVKVVSTRRDMGFWYTPLNLFILKVNSVLTDKFLVNSFAVKKNIKRKECVSDGKIQVIYNGHDLSRFLVKKKENFLEQQSIPEGSEIVGIVANFRPVKRVNDLIVAFADVLKKRQNCYLIVVGDPDDLLCEYIKITKMLMIEDNVRFLGEEHEVIGIIKYFTVAVNCSESEGLSNVIIEYMGCGIPIVATDTGGNRELIKDGKNGLLVPVGKPQALASAIIKIIEDSSLRKEITGNYKRFINEMFDENIILEQHQSFYDKLVC